MATRKEILEIGGREVAVSNPDKVYFPKAGHTKLDLVRYFVAVADGALVGVRGRPMALKRFVDGAEKEPFFQKRAPDNTPGLDAHGDAHLPLRSDRRRDRDRRGRGSRLGRQSRLPGPQPAPGPRRGPRPPGRAADRPRPGAGRAVVAGARGRPGLPRGARRRRPHRLAEDVRLAWHPHQRAHRAALDVPAGPARRPGPRPGRGAPGARPSRPRSGGRRSATASSSTTTRTPRTGRSRPPTPCGPRPTRGSRSRCAGTRCRTWSWRTSRLRRCPRSTPSGATPARASTGRWARWTRCSSCRARDEAEGQGDAPWPPNYAKQEGEPPRVQPSRMRRKPERVRGAGQGRRAAARGGRGDGRPPWPPGIPTRACRPSGRARAPPRPGGAARASRSSSWDERRRRPRSTRGSNAGRHATPTRPRTWSPPTSSRPRCVAGRTRGIACASTSSTCPEAIRPPQEELDPDAAPDDWANLSDDERAAWMAGRTPSRRARTTGDAGDAPRTEEDAPS